MTKISMPPDPEHIRLIVADTLTEMGKKTGDARYVVAAGIVRGERNGRRRMADELAVEQMREMIETRESGNPFDAARRVAKSLPSTRNLDSSSRRLYRKYRTKFDP